MMWRAMIDRVDNGFILTFCNSEGTQVIIIDERGESGEDVLFADESYIKARLMQMLSYELCEFFGLVGSKHQKYRFRAQIINQYTGKELD